MLVAFYHTISLLFIITVEETVQYLLLHSERPSYQFLLFIYHYFKIILFYSQAKAETLVIAKF